MARVTTCSAFPRQQAAIAPTHISSHAEAATRRPARDGNRPGARRCNTLASFVVEGGKSARSAFDFAPSAPYGTRMPKLRKKGAAEVRNQLSRLLAEAAKGHATIITRRGRPIAALVPLENIGRSLQQALTPLAGSGTGYVGS